MTSGPSVVADKRFSGVAGPSRGRAPRWEASWRGGVALVVLCLAVYLPGFSGIAPVDRDESRFAQASRQMLEAQSPGGCLVPMVQDRPRLNKPPLIYWLQASSAAVCAGRWRVSGPEAAARDAIWMYRVPSLLAAVVAVLATWRLGLRMFAPPAALLGAAMLAVCPVMAWEARQARADMVLLAFTTLTMSALWGALAGSGVFSPARQHDAASETPARASVARVLPLYVFMALGVMTKGPVTPMVAATALLALCVLMRSTKPLRAVRPVLGAFVVLAVVTPWVVAVAREVGWSAYAAVVRAEVLGRSLEPKEGHAGPPGYHLALMPVLFWPGSIAAGVGVVRAARRGLATRGQGLAERLRGLRAAHAPESFLLCWILPSWLVFEAVGTKLPHYTMPLYPALALLAGRAVYAMRPCAPRQPRIERALALLGAWFGVALLATVMAAAGFGLVYVLGTQRGQTAGATAAFLSLAGSIACVAPAIGAAIDRRPLRLLAPAVAGFLLANASVGYALSNLPDVRTSRNLARMVDAIDPAHSRPLAAVGYAEDSLIFETRGRAQRVEADALERFAAEHPDALVLIDDRAAGRFPALHALGVVRGFNYSKGRAVTVTVGEFPR